MKLKVFYKFDDLIDEFGFEPILLPFLDQESQIKKSQFNDIFESYISNKNLFFESSCLEKSDIAIVPINLEKILSNDLEEKSVNWLEKAKETNTISLGFFGGDCSHLKLNKEPDLMFRNSLFKSTRSSNDFAYPAWSEDLLSKYFNKKLPTVRPKLVKPTIGFCGFSADNNLINLLKMLLYQLEKYLIKCPIPRYHIGHVFRSLALSKLSSSLLVNSNFIIRNQSFFQDATSNPILQKKQKCEFIQNMLDSDYIFCCRGSGNYSFRFYEALSLGRIPIFLNTDCVLPYDFEVNWRQYCIWIDEDELPSIANKVAEFHENISEQDFRDLQYECRKIWEERISPNGFFANLYRHLFLI